MALDEKRSRRRVRYPPRASMTRACRGVDGIAERPRLTRPRVFARNPITNSLPHHGRASPVHAHENRLDGPCIGSRTTSAQDGIVPGVRGVAPTCQPTCIRRRATLAQQAISAACGPCADRDAEMRPNRPTVCAYNESMEDIRLHRTFEPGGMIDKCPLSASRQQS